MEKTDLDYCIEKEVYDDNGKLVGIQRTYPNRVVMEAENDDSE